jgi:hypothetical protein
LSFEELEGGPCLNFKKRAKPLEKKALHFLNLGFSFGEEGI